MNYTGKVVKLRKSAQNNRGYSDLTSKEGFSQAMRIDKYLKVSRLIKRRTVANDAADAGRIIVNGKIVKPSYNVKEGDIIEIAFGNRTVKARVLRITESTKKEDAAGMYELL